MSEIKVDTLTGKTTANDITVTAGATATMSLEQGLAKAWNIANNSASLIDSLNTSSGTDNGTGDYSYNLTNNTTGGNYVVHATIAQSNTGSTHNDSAASSNYRVSYTDAAFNRADRVNNSSAHGDLA